MTRTGANEAEKAESCSSHVVRVSVIRGGSLSLTCESVMSLVRGKYNGMVGILRRPADWSLFAAANRRQSNESMTRSDAYEQLKPKFDDKEFIQLT